MKTTVIGSFEEYIRYTEDYKNRYLFRGQANLGWNLCPSIFREKNKVSLDKESEILSDKIKEHGESVITTLFKLQHYGTPTRLLDLTISPLSALFFSVDDVKEISNDGIIYVIEKDTAITCSSAEIDIFSKALMKSDLNFSEVENEHLPYSEIIRILTKNYIIHYDYNFSYSNARAMLQGGTALLCGFDYIDGKFVKSRIVDIDDYVAEKIIIPSTIKKVIKIKLEQLGYCGNILYESFENGFRNTDFEIMQSDFKLVARADFNKIVGSYKISTLEFDKDKLTRKVMGLYSRLYLRYGNNARIWLSFFVDENDIENFNWVCQTRWNQDGTYTISWNKDYYIHRLRNINEQVSVSEIVTKVLPLILIAKEVHDRILQIAKIENYNFKTLLQEMKSNSAAIKKCLNDFSDTAHGISEVEKFSKAADAYINDVDRLVNDIILFSERNEKEQFLRYWCTVLLKDCDQSLQQLDKIEIAGLTKKYMH